MLCVFDRRAVNRAVFLAVAVVILAAYSVAMYRDRYVLTHKREFLKWPPKMVVRYAYGLHIYMIPFVWFEFDERNSNLMSKKL